MSIHTIYVDIGDEITTVIEQLKRAHEPIVALVVPKGAILIQSIVNLKLAKRAAIDAEKDLVLVTTDKIGRNLATQVGISIASSEKEVAKVASGLASDTNNSSEPKVIAGVRIHRYYDDTVEETASEEPASSSSSEDPASVVVPRSLLSSPNPASVQPEAAEQPASNLPDETIAPSPSSTPEVVSTPPTQPDGSITRKKMEPHDPTIAQERAGQKRGRKRTSLFLAFLILLLLAGGAVASPLVYPKTTVTLAVAANPWSESVTVTAKPGAATDPLQGSLPAELIKVTDEVSTNFSATGTKRIGQAASGTATVFNSQESSPQTLPAGSKLTANGRSFTTNVAVTIPGVQVRGGQLIAGSTTVAITADEVGPESNLQEVVASISGTIGSKLYAQVTSTTGGSSEEVAVVTTTDIANAKAAATKALQEKLATKLEETVKGRTLTWVDGSDSFTLEQFITTVEASAEAKDGQTTAKGSLERLVVETEQVTNLLNQYLESKAPAGEQRITESLELGTPTYNKEEASLTFNTTAQGKSSPLLHTAELPNKLAGKSLAEGRRLLEEETKASTISIEQKPVWWPLQRFPVLDRTITVQVTYE